MEYVFSSSNKEIMLVLPSTNESNCENLDSNHEEDASFFGQLPSPFLEEILHNNHQEITTTPNEPPPKTKRVRKQRSAGKKDRHSKIHTAQGLRDRRMRLSLQIARKFFGLQDMLGFDKASKTIEWLFSKSKKAIDELNESVRSQNTTQSVCRENIESCESPVSDCEVDSGIEFDTGSNKGKETKNTHEFPEYRNSKTRTTSDLLARESRNKARARARERTRERMLINNPNKHTQIFGENPNDDFDQLQLGFSANPNDHYLEQQSRSPNEYSGTHHFFDHAHLKNIAQETQDYMGNVVTATASSSNYLSGSGNKNFTNLPAGWLNSSNTFLGFLGDRDTENFIENYGLLPNLAPLVTGDNIHGQNFSSVFIPPNLLHFQTQNQRD